MLKEFHKVELLIDDKEFSQARDILIGERERVKKFYSLYCFNLCLGCEVFLLIRDYYSFLSDFVELLSPRTYDYIYQGFFEKIGRIASEMRIDRIVYNKCERTIDFSIINIYINPYFGHNELHIRSETINTHDLETRIPMKWEINYQGDSKDGKIGIPYESECIIPCVDFQSFRVNSANICFFNHFVFPVRFRVFVKQNSDKSNVSCINGLSHQVKYVNEFGNQYNEGFCLPKGSTLVYMIRLKNESKNDIIIDQYKSDGLEVIYMPLPLIIGRDCDFICVFKGLSEAQNILKIFSRDSVKIIHLFTHNTLLEKINVNIDYPLIAKTNHYFYITLLIESDSDLLVEIDIEKSRPFCKEYSSNIKLSLLKGTNKYEFSFVGNKSGYYSLPLMKLSHNGYSFWSGKPNIEIEN